MKALRFGGKNIPEKNNAPRCIIILPDPSDFSSIINDFSDCLDLQMEKNNFKNKYIVALMHLCINCYYMNNILGQPVEGIDFYDRERDTEQIWSSLKEGNHILLLAPRRVGKTSLAIRIGKEAIESKWKFALVDVQRDRDELGFLDNLFQNLKSAGVKVPILTRLTELITYARRNLSGKTDVGDFSVEIDPGDGQEKFTLEHQIERLFREIEESEEKVLIAVDELPVLLEALQENDKDHKRLRGFLNWFRAIRIRYRKNVRWLMLGSVGLDTFAELRKLTATINDLQPASLGAYDEPTAIAFLKELAESKNIYLADEHCQQVLLQIGWPLPFFLQLVFHELYPLLGQANRHTPTEADIKQSCEELLAPQFYKHFEPWRGRLSEGLDADHHRAAVTILNALCVTAGGLTRNRLLGAVQIKFPNRDSDDVARIVATTLGQLERDGYLLKQALNNRTENSYAFRSFLLRRYWHSRELA
jgi:hypothetical protein